MPRPLKVSGCDSSTPSDFNGLKRPGMGGEIVFLRVRETVLPENSKNSPTLYFFFRNYSPLTSKYTRQYLDYTTKVLYYVQSRNVSRTVRRPRGVFVVEDH